MYGNREKGYLGEKIAARQLIKKGYKIIDTNYYGIYGEIDIIAFKDGYTVFIEVKLRKCISKGLPREAVTQKKQKRILLTAKEYISENNLCDNDFRFDVIEILEDGKKILFNHIENAFGA